MHQEIGTFITTQTAIDPLRSAGNSARNSVTLDGFFG